VLAALATASLLEAQAGASQRTTVSADPSNAAAIATSEIVSDSNRTGNFEIYSMSLTGANSRAITNDPSFDSRWPRISPDRHRRLDVPGPRRMVAGRAAPGHVRR
jgi:Tol biopolymer transport system component